MIKRILRSLFRRNYIQNVTNNYTLTNDQVNFETSLMLQAKNNITLNLSKFPSDESSKRLFELEFKVFSQFGDDGIINWLINYLEIGNKKFIEFGVTDYIESNTRFLLMNDNWDGLVMDGSDEAIKNILNSHYYWKHNLKAKQLWVTKENINEFITEYGYSGEIGLLHIDLDGNDYWIYKELTNVKPDIFIAEYNSIFELNPWTIPYDSSFYRTSAHYSNLYWGSGLKPIYDLAIDRGYSFIGCNSAGNNAYFVRTDKMKDLKPIYLENGYVCSKYRESRNEQGDLTFVSSIERLKVIQGLPVFNTIKNEIEFI
jgi:hypothetical protein